MSVLRFAAGFLYESLIVCIYETIVVTDFKLARNVSVDLDLVDHSGIKKKKGVSRFTGTWNGGMVE